MLTIVLLGTGNVAHHLFSAIRSSSAAQVIQVYGRSDKGLKDFKQSTSVTSSTTAIADADLYLVAVKDDVIAEVSALLQKKNGLVAHTSGTIPMESLQNGRRAVFYPLQTFTKDIPVDFSRVPICLEAEHEEDFKPLEVLAKSLSQTVCRMGSEQRLQLHLSAIFANLVAGAKLLF